MKRLLKCFLVLLFSWVKTIFECGNSERRNFLFKRQFSSNLLCIFLYLSRKHQKDCHWHVNSLSNHFENVIRIGFCIQQVFSPSQFLLLHGILWCNKNKVGNSKLIDYWYDFLSHFYYIRFTTKMKYMT